MMYTYSLSLLAIALAIDHTTAYSIPSNVQSFYNSIVSAGQCSNQLQSGFAAIEGSSTDFCYCGDHLADYGVIYLQGTGGALADMDIDCDGLQHGPSDDGRCDSSYDTQYATSFESQVQGYGITELNSFVHPYVVFGNTGTNSGYINFDPTSYGVEPLSVMAVVCNGQMFYGIWGDENGDDGPPLIGEASISMGTFCFGTSVNGDNGYSNTDVLYIAFTGSSAVPGQNGADWGAQTSSDFESSIKSLGDSLIQRIGGGGGGTQTTVSGPTGTSTGQPTDCTACSWTGHCAGATCSTDNDCDGDLHCTGGYCDGCTWAGHCRCASCSSDSDCSDVLVCTNGICSI